MTEYEKKKLDFDFIGFTKRNFVKPKQCKNIEQIQFYVKELTEKIGQMKDQHQYVPDQAYRLLTEYNQLQNKLLYDEFKNTYH